MATDTDPQLQFNLDTQPQMREEAVDLGATATEHSGVETPPGVTAPGDISAKIEEVRATSGNRSGLAKRDEGHLLHDFHKLRDRVYGE